MDNNNYNDKKMKFIKNVALEYRLSLFNICKLLKIEPTKENKKIVYDRMISICDKVNAEQRAINSLISETATENEKEANKSLLVALYYLGQVTIATNSGDAKQINEANIRLFRTDYDFKDLASRINPRNITVEDMKIIARYRIKYALTKTHVASMIRLDKETISHNEKKLLLEDQVVRSDNERLCNRLEKLNEMILSDLEQKLAGQFRRK